MGNRHRQAHTTATAEAMVDFLKPVDQIAHLVAMGGAARGGAKMGAAAEGPALIDAAPAGGRMEKRATSIRRNDNFLSSGRFSCLRGHERLAGSVAFAALAVMQGAAIVRAHDVAATVDAVKVASALRRAATGGDGR